ncbi:hypothetical protein NQ317_000793 [Molorchus minor]|nr:hypothetical protein NQ317_000793 [Molorchus minor]
MPSSKYCLVCGFSKDEVEKMHRFPVNEAKSKVWQENMGIKHVPGIKLSNHVICSRHFSPNAYANLETMKLLRDAVPTLFSCRQDPIQERVIEMDVLSSTNTGESFVTNSPVPSCSGMQMRTPIAGCRSLFTDQEGEPVQSSSGMQQRATASR